MIFINLYHLLDFIIYKPIYGHECYAKSGIFEVFPSAWKHILPTVSHQDASGQQFRYASCYIIVYDHNDVWYALLNHRGVKICYAKGWKYSSNFPI